MRLLFLFYFVFPVQILFGQNMASPVDPCPGYSTYVFQTGFESFPGEQTSLVMQTSGPGFNPTTAVQKFQIESRDTATGTFKSDQLGARYRIIQGDEELFSGLEKTELSLIITKINENTGFMKPIEIQRFIPLIEQWTTDLVLEIIHLENYNYNVVVSNPSSGEAFEFQYSPYVITGAQPGRGLDCKTRIVSFE